MYPIRMYRQTTKAKQGTANAAEHHNKRRKGARGQWGSAEGGGLFRVFHRHNRRNRRGASMGGGSWAICAWAARGLPFVGALYA